MSVPLTFPAHQAVVLPVKLRWPAKVDATALCIGAAAPDLAYPILGNEGHTLIGAAVFALPFTLAVALVLRRGAAAGVFGNLPDLGLLRLHSYRVITKRRPPLGVTLVSAVLGILSHLAVDSVTHADRVGSVLLGLDVHLFSVPVLGMLSAARLLQYLGHTVGSLVGVMLFAHVGRRRLLERWYGDDEVAEARSFSLTLRSRVNFWVVAGGVTAAVYLALLPAGGRPVFKVMLASVIGLLGAGCLRCSAGEGTVAPTAESLRVGGSGG